MWALLLAVSLWRGADAFSNYAGACEHAGVQHGLDYFEPQARPVPLAACPLTALSTQQLEYQLRTSSTLRSRRILRMLERNKPCER